MISGTDIILVTSVVWLGSEIALSRVKHSRSSDVQLDKSSIRVLWLTIVISIVVGIAVASSRIGYVESAARLAGIAGLVSILCGLVIRWIAILTLRRYFTVDVAIAKDHHLVRAGIYRFVRHPAYTGSLLSFAGLGLSFSNYLTLALIVVPISAAFLHRIRIEEEALVRVFGEEYLSYRASTRRLIPGIY